MADTTFDALDPIVEQKTTDIYAISANGSGSYKETRQQMVDYLSQSFAPNFTAENTVYVDPAGSNSNPGTQSEPFADPYFASGTLTGTLANPKLIVTNAALYNTSDFAIKPNITYSGYGIATQLTVANPITLDSSWSSGAAAVTLLKNLFFVSNFELFFTTFGSNRNIYFDNCRVSNLTISGASGNRPIVSILNSDIGGSIILEAVICKIIGADFSSSNSSLTIQSSGVGGNNDVNMIGCFFNPGGNIHLSGESGMSTNVKIFATPIRGTITVDTTFVNLQIDACSIPSGGITFTNGATSAQVTVVGDAPAKSLNNVFTGVNYVAPVSVSSSAGALAWDVSQNQYIELTLTENVTITATGFTNGIQCGARITQDATTPYTVTWDSGDVNWIGGVVPVMSTGLGAVDRYHFTSTGSVLENDGIAQNIS